jgi:phage terminase small subunit
MTPVERRTIPPNLKPTEAVFVIEYMKDYAVRRAAEASGYSPDHGYVLMKNQYIINAIETLIEKIYDDGMITADDLLNEMWDNHRIARQQGNIAASNAALALLAKHKRIDAFAADKLNVTTDADIVDRLNAGRRRVSEIKIDTPESDDVNFF